MSESAVSGVVRGPVGLPPRIDVTLYYTSRWYFGIVGHSNDNEGLLGVRSTVDYEGRIAGLATPPHQSTLELRTR